MKKSSKASCILDPIPSNLQCLLLPHVVPVIKEIINKALSSGCFPSSMKSAIVKPLLKKSTLNPEIFKNYWPVSNLSYVSKVIEKVIAAVLYRTCKIKTSSTHFNLPINVGTAQKLHCSVSTMTSCELSTMEMVFFLFSLISPLPSIL